MDWHCDALRRKLVNLQIRLGGAKRRAQNKAHRIETDRGGGFE